VALKNEVGLDGNHIKNAVVDNDQITGRPEVTFLLDPEGGDLF